MHRRERRAGVETGAAGVLLVSYERPPGQAAEVDDHVRPFGRAHHDLADPHRPVPHAALGADLPHPAPGEPRLMIRALQPLRKRNRYSRGSTSRYGQTLPLTSMVSPKYSPIQMAPGMVLFG